MCGIVGIFKKNFVNPLYVDKMLSVLTHRGPDNLGIVCFQTSKYKYFFRKVGEYSPQFENVDFVLGHARLSIIDLTELGNQPLADKENKFWIIYNGEIFNYIELRKNLEKLGYTFYSNSDTEVLLYAYKEWKESCLHKLRGFFSFCIYDLDNNKLFIARDRFGKKPFKYYWDGNHFCFASETKALLQLPWISKNINMEAIKQYLSLKYILPPSTIIADIKKLPAGSFMTFSLNKPEKEPVITRYWVPSFQPKIKISYKRAIKESWDLLKESANLRLLSDVPVGLFLSGGIDSSTILSALYYSKRDYKINTFTVGFRESNYDERYYANLMVNLYKTNHKEITVELKPEEDLEKIIWYFDEPFGDPSSIPTFYLTKAAAQYLKVIITGDGGDELFGGYKRYYIHNRNRILQYLPSFFHKYIKTFLKKIPFNWDKKHGWGKLLRIIESISGNMIDTYQLRFSGFSSRMQEILFGKNLKQKNIWTNEILQILDEMKPTNFIEVMQGLDQITYLPEDILVKSDLGGMANSIEIRCPFLDHIFAEWINSLPFSYKIEKRIIRDMIKNKVPSDIIKRKKAGFNPPIGKWIKNILQDKVNFYLLSDEAPINLFRKEEIQKMINLHCSGRINLGEPLWLLLVLAIWLKIYNIKL